MRNDLPIHVEMPPGWVVAAIDQFARTATGGTPSRAVSAHFGGNIPWVKSGELGDGLVQTTEETLSELGLKSSNAKIFPRGTLCIALYGATVGKVGILDMDATTNQAVCGIYLPSSVATRYIFYFLISKRRELIAQGKGGAQSNISNGIVRQLRVPLAPHGEQLRIVTKIEELFSDLDAGIAALERVRASLKRYRASVLKAAVEGRLSEDWRKRNPVQESGEQLLERILAERRAKWEQEQLRKFKEAGKTAPKGWEKRYKLPIGHEETYLPGIPVSWRWTSLGALAWQVRDGPHHTPKYCESGIPFITGGHIRSNGIDFTRAKYISQELHKEFCKRCKPEGGDLLYTKGGTTGIAYINRETREFSVWVHVAVLKLVDCLHKPYLALALSSPDCYAQSQKYTHGVGNQDLGLTRMVKIAVPLPPLAEQTAIVAEVDRRLSVAEAAELQVEHALQRASRLRQAILKRAFEGQLVGQDPSDESAMNLLERLRGTEKRDRREPETAKRHARGRLVGKGATR